MTNGEQINDETQESNRSSSPCLAVVSDLIFASKIQSAAQMAGRACLTVRSLDELKAALSQPATSCVLVDMAMDESLSAGAIKLAKSMQPSSTVIAFYAHVDTHLGQLATAAGADRVLPRSQFVAALPSLVAD